VGFILRRAAAPFVPAKSAQLHCSRRPCRMIVSSASSSEPAVAFTANRSLSAALLSLDVQLGTLRKDHRALDHVFAVRGYCPASDSPGARSSTLPRFSSIGLPIELLKFLHERPGQKRYCLPAVSAQRGQPRSETHRGDRIEFLPKNRPSPQRPASRGRLVAAQSRARIDLDGLAAAPKRSNSPSCRDREATLACNSSGKFARPRRGRWSTHPRIFEATPAAAPEQPVNAPFSPAEQFPTRSGLAGSAAQLTLIHRPIFLGAGRVVDRPGPVTSFSAFRFSPSSSTVELVSATCFDFPRPPTKKAARSAGEAFAAALTCTACFRVGILPPRGGLSGA